MFLIKRVVTIVSCIIGGSAGIILLGFINWVFNVSISFGHVFVYGLLGGAVCGVAAAYLLTWYLMRKAKRFIGRKMGAFASRITVLKSI